MEPRKGAAWECQRKLLNLHKIAAETLACAAITTGQVGGHLYRWEAWRTFAPFLTDMLI